MAKNSFLAVVPFKIPSKWVYLLRDDIGKNRGEKENMLDIVVYGRSIGHTCGFLYGSNRISVVKGSTEHTICKCNGYLRNNKHLPQQESAQHLAK